jgi:hypothetical protein
MREMSPQKRGFQIHGYLHSDSSMKIEATSNWREIFKLLSIGADGNVFCFGFLKQGLLWLLSLRQSRHRTAPAWIGPVKGGVDVAAIMIQVHK